MTMHFESDREHACVCMCMCACACVCVCACIYMYMCVCVCVCVCCMCVCNVMQLCVNWVLDCLNGMYLERFYFECVHTYN